MKKTLFAFSMITLLGFTAFALKPSGGYDIGDKAKPIKLKNVDGKMFNLSDLTDAKGFIVIFSCNHCPFVVAYEDRIIELNRKYAEKGYPVIAINPNDEKIEPGDSFDGMVKRAKEKGFTFPYLRDETQFYARQYGAARTPHVYVLEKEGKDVYVRYIGAIDNNTRDASAVTTRYVEDAVNELLDGKAVSNPRTKAIGCTIKWSRR